MAAQRTPDEIRSSIEANRMELAVSIDRLRGEVAHLTDWRGHVQRHRTELTAGAARGRDGVTVVEVDRTTTAGPTSSACSGRTPI